MIACSVLEKNFNELHVSKDQWSCLWRGWELRTSSNHLMTLVGRRVMDFNQSSVDLGLLLCCLVKWKKNFIQYLRVVKNDSLTTMLLKQLSYILISAGFFFSLLFLSFIFPLSFFFFLFYLFFLFIKFVCKDD